MTKEEYAQALNRLCSKYDKCVGCPFRETPEDCLSSNTLLKILTGIEKWAEEHPIKTNRDKFEEVFGIKIFEEDNNYEADCKDKTSEERLACVSEGMCICNDCKWWDEEYTEPKGEE